MNMLTNALPAILTVAGSDYPIHTDFRVWIQYELLLIGDSDRSDAELFERILRLVFPGKRPPRRHDAQTAEQIMWFYRCGKTEGASAGEECSEEIFSYDYDDGYIAAAFKQQYGVCLSREKLHWWEFRAYLLALSEDTEFVRIMGIRTMKIDPKLPAAQKSRYQQLKRLYRLPASKEAEAHRLRLEEALMNGEPIDNLL